MMITTIGIDLANNVFQVHGVDERGKTVLSKQLTRAQMAKFFAHLPACRVGMEAIDRAHFWARTLQGFGHTVRLMSPQDVKPYLKTRKTDAHDAEAICVARGRPNMRFVPVKTEREHAILALQRARQGSLPKTKNAQARQIRTLLREFGIVMPQGLAHLELRLPEILKDAQNGLPGAVRQLVARLLAHLGELIAKSENSKSAALRSAPESGMRKIRLLHSTCSSTPGVTGA